MACVTTRAHLLQMLDTPVKCRADGAYGVACTTDDCERELSDMVARGEVVELPGRNGFAVRWFKLPPARRYSDTVERLAAAAESFEVKIDGEYRNLGRVIRAQAREIDRLQLHYVAKSGSHPRVQRN